jgi:Protein of unknown function (DUF4232)
MISQNTHAGTPATASGCGPRGHPRPPGSTRGRQMLRGLGALIAAAGAVMLATACAGPPPAAGTAAGAGTVGLTSAAAVPRCLTGGLIAGLHGYEGNNDQGGFILTLTNNGQGSCSLDGYPGLGLQNARHHVLTSHTHWGSTVFAADPGRHLIVLSPGETVSASVSFAYGWGKHAVDAAYLEVTPPGAYHHAVLAIPDGIGNISDGTLYATAMARHTAYQSTHICCLS